MFKLSRTFEDPTGQRGFAQPGAGAQVTGDPSQPAQSHIPNTPLRPTKGVRSFLNVIFGANAQRGFPEAQDPEQHRPDWATVNKLVPNGLNVPVWTPYYDRGAAAYVQNYGKVTTNPIGAGVVALERPMASYGVSAEYHNGSIWWTPQNIPTSIPTQSLSNPEDLSAALGPVNVQAAVRPAGG